MSGRSLRRRLKFILPAALGLIAVAVWFLHPRPTDQQLIAEVVRRGEHGIETKNVKEIMSCVAPDYQDSQNVTRTELLRLVMQWPRVRERGEITLEDYHLDITPPHGHGEIRPYVRAHRRGRAENLAADAVDNAVRGAAARLAQRVAGQVGRRV